MLINSGYLDIQKSYSEMTSERLNLRHLRAFKAVCDTGSLSQAATVSHLSQPAITQGLAKLTKSVGSDLFIRTARGVTPTEAAYALNQRVTRAFDILARASTRTTARSQNPIAMVTMTQLRALIAVDIHRNFTLAAAHLGISQPSLYRSAKDMEAIWQQPFYVKTQRGITLSDIAERIARAAQLFLAELNQGLDDIAVLNGTSSVALNIACLPLSRGAILPQALNQITAEFPNLQIHVIDSPFDDMLRDLRLGRVDLIIGALRDTLAVDDIVQTPLFTDRLGVYSAVDHPLAKVSHVTRDDVLAYDWIVARSGTPTRDFFDHFFASKPHHPGKSMIETGSSVLVQGLLNGSQKLAMISQTQMHDDLVAGRVARVDISLPDAPRPIGVMTRKDWAPNRIQKRFIDVLHDLKS
jgi:LysR family transcriptional regulator of gallate degradation